MKKILFTTAYNVQSKVSYRYTQKLAQHYDADITLMHVYKSDSKLPGIKKPVSKQDEETRWELELGKLTGFAQDNHAKQFDNIPFDFIVKNGDVVKNILQAQKETQYDLVVMGMRKHTTVDKLFGSTAQSVLEAEINCPVLLIPPTARYLGMEKIIYGTVFQIGEVDAIEQLFDWCQIFDSSLQLFHIHESAGKEEAENKLKEMMANFKEEAFIGFLTGQLVEGNIKKALEKHLELEHADLLAIHRRKKGFWKRLKDGSLTKYLIDEAMIPLLIMP